MTPEYFMNNYLSPPDRVRFLKNRSNYYKYSLMDRKFAYWHVEDAFNWSHSPEGHEYWERINLDLRRRHV